MRKKGRKERKEKPVYWSGRLNRPAQKEKKRKTGKKKGGKKKKGRKEEDRAWVVDRRGDAREGGKKKK